MGRALTRFNHWFNRRADGYQRVIAWALDHRFATMLIAVGSLAGAVALQATKGGAGLVPVSDRGEINFIVETPPGSSLGYTRDKTEEVASLARAHPEVAYTYATIGVPIPLKAPGVDQALVYVKLVPKADRQVSQEALGRTLRGEVAGVAGAAVSVFTSGFGGAFKQIQIELRGTDARKLDALAAEALEKLKEVDGAVDVGLSTRGPKPELEVRPDRPMAGALGVSVAELAQALRPSFASLDVGHWVDPEGETRDVVVRLTPSARRRAADIRTLPVLAPVGPGGQPALVPLGQVATIIEGIAPAEIDHLNREKVVSLQANVQGRSLSEVMRDVTPRMAELSMPQGFSLSYGGETRNQREVFGRVFLALGVAVLLMYLILVMQFGSFLDPVPILVSLPFSLVGVVLALVATGDDINIMSLIGVILLMGIVAKNAILLVDFAKWSRAKGASLREALISAGRTRLRPILMTTFALVAGMMPIALGFGEGGDFRAPLGRAVVGGTLTNTLLTLLVIPTVYDILDGWRSRALGLVRQLAEWRLRGASRGPRESGNRT